MSKIGHNNPPDLILTREQFRSQIVEKMTSSTDVLVGHTIEYLMDDEGVCDASIPEIMRCSKLKCRRAVMRSLKRICDQIGLVKSKLNGAKNKYLLPQEIDRPVPLKDTGLKDTGVFKAPPFEDTTPPKPVSLESTGSRAPTRGRSLSKNNINLSPKPPLLNSETQDDQKSVCGSAALPEGFQPLGHGAIINCETIRHKDFTISIPAVDMQLQLTPDCSNEDARKHCMSFALQWAASIEAGEEAFKVVPHNITRAISSSVTNKVLRQVSHKNAQKKYGNSSATDQIKALIGDQS